MTKRVTPQNDVTMLIALSGTKSLKIEILRSAQNDRESGLLRMTTRVRLRMTKRRAKNA